MYFDVQGSFLETHFTVAVDTQFALIPAGQVVVVTGLQLDWGCQDAVADPNGFYIFGRDLSQHPATGTGDGPTLINKTGATNTNAGGVWHGFSNNNGWVGSAFGNGGQTGPVVYTAWTADTYVVVGPYEFRLHGFAPSAVATDLVKYHIKGYGLVPGPDVVSLTENQA